MAKPLIDRIPTVLWLNGPLTLAQLARYFGTPKRVVQASVANLARRGVVVKVDTKPTVWDLG